MLLALIMMASTGAMSDAEILTQIQAGQVLCSDQDEGTKTCKTMDSFVVRGDGTLIDTGETLLSPDQGMSLEVSSIVRIEGGAICGTMELTDLQKARVRMNGKLMPPDQNARVVAKLAEQLKPLAGRKVCEHLRIENGLLLKRGQMEGVDISLPEKVSIWVRPEAGYKVAPRQTR